MKRILLIYIASIMATAVALAAGDRHLVERVYIATDRDVYLAGEPVRCSAFCVDAADSGRMSGFSSIAYLELHSNDGLAATAKIALIDGRGAGTLTIPQTTPTGNYRLIAYTAQNLNEDGFDPCTNAKTISVFNTLVSARVAGGVEIGKADTPDPIENKGSVRISVGTPDNGTIPLTLSNAVGKADLSVSVFHNDGICRPVSTTIKDFNAKVDASSISFTEKRIPEYDGEIVYAKLAGADEATKKALTGSFAFISVPGDRSDTYSCRIAEDGSATFFTNNFYGNKDLVCQIEGIDPKSTCHLEVMPSFAYARISGIPALKMDKSYAEALSQRKIAAQIGDWFDCDTLYEYMPIRDNLLFGQEGTTYRLDDYTRLPLMEECITEFISDLRARKIDGKRDLQVRVRDAVSSPYFSSGASLMMLDGVPIFDHEAIYRYDPLLVETVNIYPYSYFIGSRSYAGIVNFVTYKKNLPSMKFADAVRIVSFQGASYPIEMTLPKTGIDYPDYRQTIYWKPILRIGEGESMDLKCALPQYKGKFTVVVEGLSEKGEPIYCSTEFSIE